MNSSERPTVSIIVPVYNAAISIAECVQSILCQDYGGNLDIILVDDGSKDGSDLIIERLATRHSNIRVISKDNGGVSSARNSGLDIINTKYVTFMDADDTAAKDMISSLYDIISTVDCDVVVCGINKSKGLHIMDSLMLTKDRTIQTMSGAEANKNLLYEKLITNSVYGKLYKSSILSGHRFNSEISIGEDLDFNYRLFTKIRKVTVTKRKLYNYVTSTSGAMNSDFNAAHLDALKVVKIIHADMDKSDLPMIKAVNLKMFREALYLGTKIYPHRLRHNKVYIECLALMKSASSDVLSNVNAKVKDRLYAVISSISPSLLIMTIKNAN